MKEKRKTLILTVLIIMMLAIGSVVAYYWYNNTYFVSTEDAKVTGDVVKSSTQILGRILDLNVEEGQDVESDQILGRQELLNQTEANVDLSIIRAPISGKVIKKQGNVGEIVSAGQTIAMIVDTKKLYVTANIEETKIRKLKTGQKVEITIDSLDGKNIFGKVKSIGEASAATFSILPSSSGSTFTKVIQKVPVKIELDNHDVKLIPGTSVETKIYIK